MYLGHGFIVTIRDYRACGVEADSTLSMFMYVRLVFGIVGKSQAACHFLNCDRPVTLALGFLCMDIYSSLFCKFYGVRDILLYVI